MLHNVVAQCMKASTKLLPTKQRRNRFCYLLHGCANASLNKLPFALLPQPQSKHALIFKAATQQTKKHNIFLFVYGCANASLNKFPFARATTPIQRHVHLHSCYPQTKNVPPRLQKQNCTNCVLHSARTVHAQCTVQCTPQCTATKRCKYHGIGVLLTIYKNYKNIFFFFVLIIFGKIRGIYSVLWPCTVTCTVACTVRALYVHCAKHDVCAPLYFHQQNAAILLLEACRHILH